VAPRGGRSGGGAIVVGLDRAVRERASVQTMAEDRMIRDGRALSVLIVDDSPAMRAFIRRILSLTELPIGSVAEASDGYAALRELHSTHADLILADINMPGMDGPHLIMALSADENLKNTPVLVVSTDATEYRLAQMKALGAKGYVPKPFRPERLRAAIESVLGDSEENGSCVH